MDAWLRWLDLRSSKCSHRKEELVEELMQPAAMRSRLKGTLQGGAIMVAAAAVYLPSRVEWESWPPALKVGGVSVVESQP